MSSRQAVIVSYARTGLAKAARGGFNATPHMTILGHAIEHAVKRSGADPAEIEDVIAGCVVASGHVARAAALLAGLPVTVSGMLSALVSLSTTFIRVLTGMISSLNLPAS